MTQYVVEYDYCYSKSIMIGPFATWELAEQFRKDSKLTSELGPSDKARVHPLQSP